MKIAAIDIGTNSIHTIVTDVGSEGTFEVVDQLKEMVRLGEGETRESGLTSRAIADGLQALMKAQTLCQRHGVEKIVAVATSAVREAKNGASFLDLITHQTGIHVEAITGAEEARLIYLAVRDSITLGEQRALIVDIGGGSVEFIVGDRRHLHFADTLKLGVLRLLDRFPLSDPIRPRELVPLRDYLRRKLAAVLDQLRAAGFDCVVGTSGTTLTLLNLALRREGGEGTSINNEIAPAKAIRAVCKSLLKSSGKDRRSLPGMLPGRVQSIVMGAALWDYILAELKTPQVIACERALREGVIVDYIRKHLPGIRQRERFPDPRRRSVFGLAQRCDWAEVHSKQVTAHALSLFDQLKPLHQLDATARELLEFAAYLHDIGYHISARAHHKHGHYLIRNSDLLGFTQEEIQMIAATVRFHRKRKPQRTDNELLGLTAAQRRAVEVMAGLLRIADGLDRSHFGIVQKVEAVTNERVVELRLLVRGDAELEVWFASSKANLLEDVLGRKVQVRVVTPVEPDERSQPVKTARRGGR